MDKSTRQQLIGLVAYATYVFEITPIEARSTWNFNWGFEAGIERTARLAGLTDDEISQARALGQQQAIQFQQTLERINAHAED